MRSVLFVALCSLAGALPCQSQTAAPASRPRFELPGTVARDTAVIAPRRIVALTPGGVITAERRSGSIRYRLERVHFDASLTAGLCTPAALQTPRVTSSEQVPADSTGLGRLAQGRGRCIAAPWVRPSR